MTPETPETPEPANAKRFASLERSALQVEPSLGPPSPVDFQLPGPSWLAAWGSICFLSGPCVAFISRLLEVHLYFLSSPKLAVHVLYQPKLL